MKKIIFTFTIFILAAQLVSAGWLDKFLSPDHCVDFDTSPVGNYGYTEVQSLSPSYVTKGSSTLNDQCINGDPSRIREAYCYSADVASWTSQNCPPGKTCRLDSNERAFCDNSGGVEEQVPCPPTSCNIGDEKCGSVSIEEICVQDPNNLNCGIWALERECSEDQTCTNNNCVTTQSQNNNQNPECTIYCTIGVTRCGSISKEEICVQNTNNPLCNTWILNRNCPSGQLCTENLCRTLEDTTPDTTKSFYAKVISSSGGLIAGATVKLYEETSPGSSQFEYVNQLYTNSIEGQTSPPWTLKIGTRYKFIASHTEYDNQARQTTVDSNNYVIITMDPSSTSTNEATQTNNVRIRVLNSDTGVPISGATIVFRLDGISKSAGTTGSDGYLTSQGLVTGESYDVKISKTNYVDLEFTKTLTSNAEIPANWRARSLTPICIDEDGEDTSERNTAHSAVGQDLTDACITRTDARINEAVCVHGVPSLIEIDCPNNKICRQGACVSELSADNSDDNEPSNTDPTSETSTDSNEPTTSNVRQGAGASCSYNAQCISNDCLNNKCTQPNILQSIGNWLSNLF